MAMSFADPGEPAAAGGRQRIRSWPLRYGIAVLAVAAATVLQFVLRRLGLPHLPYLPFLPAVFVVGATAGFWPGFVATLLATVAGGYSLFAANPSQLRSPEDLARPAFFAVLAMFLVALTRGRNQADEALRESETDLNRAQAVAHIGSWRFDILRGAVKLSDESYRIIGLPVQGEVSLQSAREIVHPDDLERLDNAWRVALSSGTYDQECRVVVDVRTRWVRIQASVEFGSDGRAVRAVGTLQDITEMKLANARNQEFERAVEGVEEMIAVVDRDYRYIIANAAFLKHRGTKREEVIGKLASEVIHSGVFEATIKDKLDECFRGNVVQYEMRYTYPSLGERELFITYYPIEGPTGVERVACVLQDMTERKQAEHSLRLFRALIDQSNDAVEVVDPEALRFLDVNKKACEDLGYTREELLSMTVFDINPAVNEARRLEVIAKLRQTGSLVMEGIHRRKDGSLFPVETSLRYVHLGRDYVVTFTRNITDRKRAEAALRESEDRYRDLVENSEDLACTHDLEGNLLSVNPAPARILGYTVKELLKIPMRDLIVPEGREAFEAYLERLRTTGEPEKGLLCVLTRDGEIRTWEYFNTLRTVGVEKPIVRGMAHDITEKRRAELALRGSEERYRLLFEKNIAAVALASMDGVVLDCNEAWARLLGYGSPGEIRGFRTSQFYFNIADRAPLVAELAAKGTSSVRELQLLRKDGGGVWVLFDCVILPTDSGGKMVQATAINITERKRAEEALLRDEDRFRIALKDSPVTVFNQDRSLRYTWVYNPPSDFPSDVVGQTCDDVLGVKNAVRVNELNRQVLESGHGLRTEVTFSRNGHRRAFEIILEPLSDAAGGIVGITGSLMDVARLRELADRLEEQRDKLASEKSYLEGEIEAELGFEEIIGHSPALRDVLKKARVVAPTNSTVLLLGETGTGKELVARALHSLSTRHDQSFIKLNCAAVPSGLLESELFGHEKGAFTSAVSQKVGRLELADGGTLFLDEIGELPPELQPKLLRVLQDREFERLGGVRTLRVDVRIISATNCDLRKDVAEKRFREDLFYRLNVFPIQLPALRERKSDIPMLVSHFVHKYAARMGRHIEVIPRETMKVLQNWDWPGNVRELENMIERMVILTKGRTLAPPPVELETSQGFAEDRLAGIEREHILRVLRDTHGILSGAGGAASRLGVKRTTLQSMLKRFGIEPHEYRQHPRVLS
jgi:formate hydrogenlyase transcriptional activator